MTTIIRVRSSKGTFRVPITLSSSLSDLWAKLTSDHGLTKEGHFLATKPDDTQPSHSDTDSLGSLGLKHGDMLYVVRTDDAEGSLSPPVGGLMAAAAAARAAQRQQHGRRRGVCAAAGGGGDG
eukprot:TRINITY_DN454_c1_g1_i2.p2 TRINITY_DN454_c1_g1~~TRINITY_DN454_c1_g1_i2.p2  ORF type:complete len:123 (+),score=24.51 TRINITY_DN454_c1_g1_i2:234-602(+)